MRKERTIMQMFQQIIKIPRTVWILGIVSMFTDISSELVLSVLPFFMISALGISMPTFGFIEGIAEASTLVMHLFSGILSDLWRGRKRKPFIVVGYTIAASAKILFALARGVQMIVFARIVDRIGKGMRNAPRDALIGDVCPLTLRGSCFGLRQALDTVGAWIGPVCAFVLLFFFHNNMHGALVFAVIPAFISVLVLITGIQEPVHHESDAEVRHIDMYAVTRMSSLFWHVVLLSALINFTRISEAFLLLNAHRLGMSIMMVPLVKVVMNIMYAFVAYPAGALSDRIPRIQVLMIGLFFLVFSMGTLALSTTLNSMLCGIILWGIYMGLTEGILSALVVDTTKPIQRGTGFGIFNSVAGLCVFVANSGAGIIWHVYGAPYVFGMLSIIGIMAILFARYCKNFL